MSDRALQTCAFQRVPRCWSVYLVRWTCPHSCSRPVKSPASPASFSPYAVPGGVGVASQFPFRAGLFDPVHGDDQFPIWFPRGLDPRYRLRVARMLSPVPRLAAAEDILVGPARPE